MTIIKKLEHVIDGLSNQIGNAHIRGDKYDFGYLKAMKKEVEEIKVKVEEIYSAEPVANRSLAKGALKRGYTAYVYETGFFGEGEPLFALPLPEIEKLKISDDGNNISMPKAFVEEYMKILQGLELSPLEKLVRITFLKTVFSCAPIENDIQE